MKNIIDGFPKTAHQWVYGCFNKCTFNPKSVNVDNEKEMYNAVCKTMGKFLDQLGPTEKMVSFELL
jgi:citrate synthase